MRDKKRFRSREDHGSLNQKSGQISNGSRGKRDLLKCELCRAQKHLCVFAQPTETCDRCRQSDKNCGPKMLPSDTKTLRDEKRKKIHALKEINTLAERLLDDGLSCDTIKARMLSRDTPGPAEPTHGQRTGSSHLSLSALRVQPTTSSKAEPTINDMGLHLSTQPNLFQNNDLFPPSTFPPLSSDWLTELPCLDNSNLGETSTMYNEGISNFPSETATLWPQHLQFVTPFFPSDDASDFNLLLEQMGQG